MSRCLMLILLLLSVVPQQSAQAAPPSVERLEPAAGQRGVQFDLTVIGAGLLHACEVMLYEQGITCRDLQAISDNQLVLSLLADEDCAAGTHAFRIRSPTGISELQIFRISALPVVSETEPNNAPEDAQPIELNSTVVGVIESGDVDCFVVSLKQGQRLSAEAEAIRAGGAMLDAVLHVIGPDGSWLKSVDDTPATRQDPFLSLIAPADGDYIIQLHETNFEGNESSRYALHIGNFPRPEYVYPAGGKEGERIQVVFGGDAGGPFQQTLIPEASASGTTSVFATQGEVMCPVALPFRVSPFANVLETEPNNIPAEISGDPVQLPIALNGTLQLPGDIDCFRIQVAAGEIWQLEVFAARLGSPVDSLLTVMDAAGRIVGASDDSGSHDSKLTLTFRESGVYTVQIADKRGNGSDGHFYRVEIGPSLPRLTAFLSRPDRKSQERQAISVPRGNRVLTFLACQRIGLRGDVFLTASGLPSGVTLPTTRIPEDRFWVPMVIEAAEDAAVTGSLVDVEAIADTETGSVTGRFRQIVDLVAGSADQLFQSTETDRLAVAVVEEVPYRITLKEPQSSLTPDGTLNLEIVAERCDGFTGSIDVSFSFLPPWVDGPDKVTIPLEKTTANYTVRAWPQAEPRVWDLCAEARAGTDTGENSGTDDREGERRSRRRVRVVRTAVASNMVQLAIENSPVSGSIGEIVLEQGVGAKVICELQSTGILPDVMTAVLQGLPNRVVAREVSVPRGSNQVEFHVIPESSAPVGEFPDLVVSLSGQVNGQDVSWNIGRGGILKIQAAGTLVTDDDGRPLSRLEVLRSKRSATNTTDAER